MLLDLTATVILSLVVATEDGHREDRAAAEAVRAISDRRRLSSTKHAACYPWRSGRCIRTNKLPIASTTISATTRAPRRTTLCAMSVFIVPSR
jgi:hypothetical protein